MSGFEIPPGSAMYILPAGAEILAANTHRAVWSDGAGVSESAPAGVVVAKSGCAECDDRTAKYGCRPRSCNKCWQEDNPGGVSITQKFRVLDKNAETFRRMWLGDDHE